MIGLQLLCVTVLLIFASGSVSDIGITASTIFGVTLITTFVCFNFRLRLEFEGIFKFFETLGIGVPRYIGEESECTSLDVRRKHHGNGLNDLPRPLARQVKRFIDAVIRDFISSWYVQIGGNEKDFIHDTERALEYIAAEIYHRMLEIDTHLVAASLINMYRRHLKIFDECRAAVNRKYPGIPQKDFEKCIVELYEARISSHVATRSQGAELDVLRVLTDVFVFTLLPPNMFSCEGGRFMLREVLAIQGLKQLVDLLTEPQFVNQAIIDILDETLPIHVIRQQWEQAMEEEESVKKETVISNDDNVDSIQDKDMVDSDNGDEINNDDYEVSDTNTNDSKFATPRHSSSEHSSEESYDDLHRVLRQNQLEAKSSEPVYGSTTVKLHDNAKQIPIKYIVPYGHQIGENKPVAKSDALSEVADSGILSISQKLAAQPNLHGPKTLNLIKPDEKQGRVANFYISSGGIGVQGPQYESKEPNSIQRSQEIQIEGAEAWTNCPLASSNTFHRQSFYDMCKVQDRLSEQFKAKLMASGADCMVPSTCLQALVSSNKPKAVSSRTQSMDGSARMEFPSSCANEVHDTLSTESASNTKIHGTEGRNTFYELSPTCPTCVEMTLLANPHENGKLVPVSCARKDSKKKTSILVEEHECGLREAHFCSPETDNELVLPGVSDDTSFVSCDDSTVTELELSVNSIASSDTLLASGESTISSNSSIYKSGEGSISRKPQSSSNSSLEVVSIHEAESEHSTLIGDEEKRSFCSEISDDTMVIRSPPKKRTPSIITFKSAVDSLSSKQEDPLSVFQTPRTPAKRRRSSQDKVFHKTKVKPIKIPKVFSGPGPLFKFFKEKFASSKDERLEQFEGKSDTFRRTSGSEFGSVKDWDEFGYHIDMPSFEGLSDSDAQSVHSEHLENRLYDQGNKIGDVTFKTPHADPILSLGPKFDKLFSEHAEGPKFILADELGGNNVPFGLVEEVGSEVEEDLDIYEDALSVFEEPAQRALSKRILSEDSLASSSSEILDTVQSHITPNIRKGGVEEDPGSHLIPVYKGEMIVSNPSKVPATAWLYPIQMVSIPNTEVAFEKGWEPGGNKYTLYSIHYDIRIWPDSYQGQILEASVSKTQEGSSDQVSSAGENVPLIREIKRRYREFIYLHNRLTHGVMASKMKGILRPNRRYAMPFGRMDPDVIEGRRKILEYYLVSLVSRPELCNSREFKEFLGAEGYGNVSFIKPRAVQPKMLFNKQMNKIISGIKTAFPNSSREGGEKTGSSQYFIHGYDTPRMFGYGNPQLLEGSALVWLRGFIDRKAEIGEHGISTGQVQRAESASELERKLSTVRRSQSDDNGRRTLQSDKQDQTEYLSSQNLRVLAAETRELQCTYSDDGGRIELGDRRVSGGIAALFAAQMAANRGSEKISELDAEICRKSGESPWPLSDAVLSLACQALKGYGSWITYEKVQQATLFGLGGIIEWLICRAIDDILIEERWLKYLRDLHAVIWDVEANKLKEKKPPLTTEEQKQLKEEALSKLLEVIPGLIRVSIGPAAYTEFGESLLQSLQYKKINKHILFAALDIVLSELIPEFQSGFEDYLTMSSSSANRKPAK